MACLHPLDRLLKRHSLYVNVTINVGLLLLCTFSYATLVALYCTWGLGIDQFTETYPVSLPNTGITLPPTVVVPLLGVILTSATSALLTRAVEHNLWGDILRNESVTPVGGSCQSQDASKRAQWSTSSLARLTYCFNGRCWTLRFGGLFLLTTAIVNPVLLLGIAPGYDVHPRHNVTEPTQSAFSGFTSEISEESPLPDGK